LSDTTTVIDGTFIQNNNLSVCKQLEGIKEDDGEDRGTLTKERLKDAGFIIDKTSELPVVHSV